jgi:ADP-ribose pyrophosphatase
MIGSWSGGLTSQKSANVEKRMPEERWIILNEEKVLDHPYVNVTYQSIQLPDGRIIPDWPMIQTRDYVNALVLNESGQIMILKGYKHGHGRSSWQVLGGYLEPGEDPEQAVQRELLEETGYQSDQWQHLGSFTIDANRHVGTGHFFLARDARRVAAPDHADLEQFAIDWVNVEVLQQALFDGRVAIASYAINIALALLAMK